MIDFGAINDVFDLFRQMLQFMLPTEIENCLKISLYLFCCLSVVKVVASGSEGGSA